MAQASNKPAKVVPIPADELAEIMEAEVEKDTLPGGTIRETNTIYEDRTTHPVIEVRPEPSVIRVELDNGTVMETYGMPEGADEAESE